MKRLILLILSLCLLTSCALLYPAPPEPAPTPAQPPVQTSPAPEAPVAEEAAESDTAMPSLVQPTATITPLTNAPLIYSHGVRGDVTFIRIADQSRVELPPQTRSYQPVRDNETNVAIAYALLGYENVDYRMAFMSLDGEILTGFIYESFGEDTIFFPNHDGRVYVLQQNGNYALLDLATGGLVEEYGDTLPESAFTSYDYDYIWPEENLEYLPADDLYRRIRFEPQYSMQLEDAQGNIIVPFGSYGYVWLYPPFLIGSSEENSDPDFDILNMQGEVILHNPLGALTRERASDDFLVVWLDEKTCVFLYPDGSTVPVENPPQVERVYIGG